MPTTIDMSALQPKGVTESLLSRMADDLKQYWDSGDGLAAEKVQTVDCSLCGAPYPEDVLFYFFRFPYRKCPVCQLVYPSPRPNAASIEEQYRSGRFAAAFRELYVPTGPYRMATIFKERVEELIMPRVPTGRLLDVGCSTGHFLKVAANNGFDVYGVEPNADMVQFATNELQLPNISCGLLNEVPYPAEFFDVVTVWDVLEHVETPAQLLAEIKPILKPGGWVFAYTENFDSFNVFITGERSDILAPDVHLRHYTPATFRREFEQAGYKVETVYTMGLDLAHIQKALPLYPDVFPQDPWQLTPQATEVFQSFINRHNKGDNLRLFARKAGLDGK